MAHPCLDHHLVESLLLHAFKPSPEVLRKPVGKFIVAPNRLGEALQCLVDVGLDLTLPPSMTPAVPLMLECRFGPSAATIGGGASGRSSAKRPPAPVSCDQTARQSHTTRRLWFVDVLCGKFTRLAVVLNRIGRCL